MKKCLFLLMAMAASSALAQQNVDITAAQFNSGEANARLTSLGREAAASGKRLVVTAPQQWHAQIAARIRAGGTADIVLKDGFYETLLVRVVDEAPEPVKPEPKPAVAPAAKPAPLPVVRKPEPPKAVIAPPPAEPVVEMPPPAPAPTPAPEPVVETPPPAATAPATAIADEPAVQTESAAPAVVDPKAPILLVAAEPGDTDSLRASMEKRYNEAKRIEERVETNQLKVGDVIYAGKGAAVVVRREGSRLLRMWLIGSLNVNQLGIEVQGVNKYKVLNGVIQ